MFILKSVLLLASCLILVAESRVVGEDLYATRTAVLDEYEPVLSRHARSLQGGSVDLSYTKDQLGREAALQYNHNLYTSKDGRGSIDAYAQGSRNFDYNRNNYGGGIQGTWRF